MFTPTALIVQAAHEHVNDLIEEASRHRLASALRRGRRQLWPESLPATGRPVARAARPVPYAERDRKAGVKARAGAEADAEKVSYPAGRLTECEAGLTRGRVR